MTILFRIGWAWSMYHYYFSAMMQYMFNLKPLSFTRTKYYCGADNVFDHSNIRASFIKIGTLILLYVGSFFLF